MIVVTDTSVVLNLCLIGQEGILSILYGTIIAPNAVVSEFERLACEDVRFQGLVFPAFIVRAEPTRIPASLTVKRRLQAGEIAALALAFERKADAVLMDEIAGRAVAVSLGLKPVGLLGILLDAKERTLVSTLAPLLDRLEKEGEFWISATLRTAILKRAGEVS